MTAKLIDGKKLAAKLRQDYLGRVQALSTGTDNMPVLVSADKNVKYDAVMEVVRRLRTAGVQRVALSTL